MIAHQQELVPLGDLQGAEYNPRVMAEPEMLRLMRSIEEFGFVQSVVARRADNLIIGGHQRVEALRRLLVDKDPDQVAATLVPVVFLDGIDDQRAKLLNLALNKIHGDWDYGKLSDLLTDLQASVPATVELSGFTEFEISNILDLASMSSPAANLPDPDEELARQARRLVFELGTDADLALCKSVLERFGMTSPANAAPALVAALRAAMEQP